jgi:hypothetical protein
MSEDIDEICQQFADLRARPSLLLILPSISRSDVVTLCSVLDEKSFENLDVLLLTPGGDPDAAFLIVKI